MIRDAARATAARLVWICAPNNPTGDAHDLAEIEELANSVDALVAVDEVYVELAEASLGVERGALSAIGLIERHPNLIVVRSMSKAYGLAGARLGYLVAGPEVAERLDGIRLSLPVAAPSQRLALAALGDQEAVRLRHETLVDERRRVEAALDGLGWERLPSVTNFILFRPPDAGQLAAALHREGIIVRAYDGDLAAWLRVTVRSGAENDRSSRESAPRRGDVPPRRRWGRGGPYTR